MIVLILLLPLIAAIMLPFIRRQRLAVWFALTVAFVEFLLVTYEWITFIPGQLITFQYEWLTGRGLPFTLSIDGLSIVLQLLTAFLVPIIILSTFNKQQNYSSSFYALILLMQAALLGVFCVSNVLWFYVFYELALIPIYFICAFWGGVNRISVTLKFFIYTLAGSLLMLAAIVYLYTKLPAGMPFDFAHLKAITLNPVEQSFIFWAFFIAFAVKTPIFPFHSWQPETYSVAPTAGSMLLAGIMLKMGLYGIIRILIPVCMVSLNSNAVIVICLSIAGILYAAIIAIKQNHLKRLIAFSSLSHVGLMAAALLILSKTAMTGAIFQMLAHGVNVVAMFMIADSIYRRTSISDFSELGGIAHKAPAFATIAMIVMLANVALPLTNAFVGEFLMLTGMFRVLPLLTAIAGLSVIFGAVYMLRMYQKTFYGEQTEIEFEKLSTAEWFVYIPLLAAIIWMGVYPSPLIKLIEPVVNSLIQ